MFVLKQSDKEACVEFLQDLVRIPSPTGQEGELADRLAEEMDKVGFQDVRVDRVGNVIGRIGKGGGKKLMFDAHMDTVLPGDPASWTHDPFGAEIVDGVMYGRGTMDMKGAMAAMVYGAKALLDAGVHLDGDLYMVGVVSEEPGEGTAVKALVEEEGLRPDYVVLGEATNLQVSPGHRGRVLIRVNVHGRSCHASRPDEGVNAIYAAARVIFGIELLPAHFLTDPVLGSGSVTVTEIRSGETGSHNVVPDLCTFTVDRRLTLGETVNKALAEIDQVVKREGASADLHVEEFDLRSYTGYLLHVREAYPAWLMPSDHPLVEATVRAVIESLGYRPRLVPWQFSTDGAYTMGEAGIPTVGFGPGEERVAHTADEHVKVADVIKAARTYAQIAVEVLGMEV